MELVFVLWNVHDTHGASSEKLIGIYKSRNDAEAAIRRVRDEPGLETSNRDSRSMSTNLGATDRPKDTSRRPRNLSRVDAPRTLSGKLLLGLSDKMRLIHAVQRSSGRNPVSLPILASAAGPTFSPSWKQNVKLGQPARSSFQ